MPIESDTFRSCDVWHYEVTEEGGKHVKVLNLRRERDDKEYEVPLALRDFKTDSDADWGDLLDVARRVEQRIRERVRQELCG